MKDFNSINLIEKATNFHPHCCFKQIFEYFWSSIIFCVWFAKLAQNEALKLKFEINGEIKRRCIHESLIKASEVLVFQH